MKKKKKKTNGFNAAAAIFGVAVIAAVTTFVISGSNSDVDNVAPVIETNLINPNTTNAAETVPPQPTETSPSRAYVVTADTADLLPDDYVPPETVYDENDTIDDEYSDNTESSETAAPTQTRTVITSRERTEFNGKSVYVDMKNILQNPELPVGCEITSLTILLNYWGFDAEKCDMARNYLPISSGRYKYEDGKTYKDSFFDYFIGDPFSRGYGCFSNAVEKAANSYITQHGGGFSVLNLSGCSPDTLYSYLEDEIPVIVWATDGMIEPEYYETWYDIDTGEQLDWYLNEHCAVLVGFDIDNGTITLNDPMKGIIDYNIDKFETRFAQMYSQAIVILPAETDYSEETSVYEEYTETEYTATVYFEEEDF